MFADDLRVLVNGSGLDAEVIDVAEAVRIIDEIMRARGPSWEAKFTRPGMAWDADPRPYLREWAPGDSAILTNRAHLTVLFLTRDGSRVHTGMYVSMPNPAVGFELLYPTLRALGVTSITAVLPKAVGRAWLVRHQTLGYHLIGEDAYRWFVSLPL